MSDKFRLIVGGALALVPTLIVIGFCGFVLVSSIPVNVLAIGVAGGMSIFAGLMMLGGVECKPDGE